MSGNDLADWDAAYVLGALSAEDRRAYEDYLADNPARAVALTEFAGLPGILNVLTPDEAVALDAVPVDDAGIQKPLDLMPSLARAAARRERRSRRTVIALVAATAAAFLAVGVIVTSIVFGRTNSTPSAPELQAMTATPGSGMTASLAVTPKKWGTRLDWECTYGEAPPGTSYDLVVTTDDGKQTAIATWKYSGTPAATGLAAATGIPTAAIRAVDIRTTGSPTPLAVTTLH
jgi:anti-sigma factor RsiW